ncbi:Hypothetical protein CAP_5899 [Chondromyces apiculatus DSM 436]|uniref:Uncharacterized protein n=1 Tax=Chondromyces apiculatus DSM 436 TaxID=1192034 RepID=A0A017TFY9_9BACT|nr:Hypothetical protein CAP_5899 [Chondromyces apiculatus DSM 436]
MFIEGGWAMWPILVFGMVTIGASGRFAYRPALGQLRFIAAMAILELVTTVHATWLCIGSVMSYLGKLEGPEAEQSTRILFTGLMESTRPGGLGGMLLMVSGLLVAVGMLRLGAKKD